MPQAAQNPLNLVSIRFLAVTSATVALLLLGACDNRQPPKYPTISEIYLVPKKYEYALSTPSTIGSIMTRLHDCDSVVEKRKILENEIKPLFTKIDNENGFDHYKVTMKGKNDGTLEPHGSISIDGDIITFTDKTGLKRIGKYNGTLAYIFANGDLVPTEAEWRQAEEYLTYWNEPIDFTKKTPEGTGDYAVDQDLKKAPVLYTNRESALTALTANEATRIAMLQGFYDGQIEQVEASEAAAKAAADKSQEAQTSFAQWVAALGPADRKFFDAATELDGKTDSSLDNLGHFQALAKKAVEDKAAGKDPKTIKALMMTKADPGLDIIDLSLRNDTNNAVSQAWAQSKQQKKQAAVNAFDALANDWVAGK